MNILIIFITLCSVYLKCECYDVWNPLYLTDLLTNQTKELSNHISMSTNSISNSIIKYADMAKQKQDSLTSDMENFIENAGKQFNDTLVYYIKSASNLGNDDQNKIENIDIKQQSIEMDFDMPRLAAMNGYNVETHTVVTDDGYILTLHRIPHAKNKTMGQYARQAVILQHGLLSSSVDFVTNGPKRGLAYVLAESGYDVWLGNFRGNTYSRAHIKLSPSNPEFWNFSWHEMALHDLPAIIDYVNAIKKSDRETLYIGHSMGNTALFALLSMKPEYNSKLKAAFCLAPVGYMTDIKSPLALFASIGGTLDWARDFGANEFIPNKSILKWLASNCDNQFSKDKLCGNLLFLLSGYNEAQLDRENLYNILSHTPASISTKTIIHYAQEIRDNGKFQMYDYGYQNNLKYYKQKNPPEYPIHKITLPMAFYVSHNDYFVGISDAENLYKNLSNTIEFYKVPLRDFTHIDFLWAVDIQNLLYNHLINTTKKFGADRGVLWSINPFNNLQFQVDWSRNNA